MGPPPKNTPKTIVTTNQLLDVRRILGAKTSDRDIIGLSGWLNSTFGHGTVEKNYQAKLKARYNYFKKDWEYGFLPFEETIKIGKNKYQKIIVRRPVALIKNVEEVRAKLVKLRGLQEDQVFCRLHIALST